MFSREFHREFKALAEDIYNNAMEKGFYDGLFNHGEKIVLMHAELSECLEYVREGNPPSDHIPEFTGAEEELADCVIRIMDYAYRNGHRLLDAIIAKHEFNKGRPHKHGGKAF